MMTPRSDGPIGWPLDLPPSGFKVCGACGGHGCGQCVIRRGVGVVRIAKGEPEPEKVRRVSPAWQSMGR